MKNFSLGEGVGDTEFCVKMWQGDDENGDNTNVDGPNSP